METYKFDFDAIKVLSFRDLASLLRILNRQKSKQLKYLIDNSHLNLTNNEEYMIEEGIYNSTEYKIRMIMRRMRNIIRQRNKLKPTQKTNLSKEF